MENGLKIINVASVPQRSPFRYPGGKTWLVPYVRLWLKSLRSRPEEFIEPFAGGAIVGLTAGFEQLADSVLLVERDEDVAAVWHTIFNSGHGRWLADRITEFEFTPEDVLAELKTPRSRLSLRERAFKTILRIRFEQGDGVEVIRDNAGRSKAAFFIDPPYTVAGRRLYTTAVFLPQRRSEGALIWSWGMRSFGPLLR